MSYIPTANGEDQIQLLVKDCEEELAHDERALGAHLGGRLTAFFFRDAAEKKRLMGAADTYIAKPWRREVYLQLHAYPHPVLGHEIAHVVAGSFGRGPFRIAGAARGWWPNPGLIEGVAVAASPDEEELTDAQWARAMMDLGILPPMQRVFSFGFLGESSAKSYTLAGAFVRWLIARSGTGVVRRWYGGEDVTALTGMTWSGLDDAFRGWLGGVTLAPETAAYAKARFDRPSVFGRKCPHVIDGLRAGADRCRDALQVDRARDLYHDVLARDPHDWGARSGLAIMELRFGDAVVGAVGLRELADDEEVPRPWRDRSAEALADTLLASADARLWQKAMDGYAELAAHAKDEDVGRTLEVKRYVASRAPAEPEGREAMVALLIGSRGRPVDAEEGLARVAAWAKGTGDPVAEYVLGKNLVNREFWAEAAEHLDRAIASGEPTVRIGRELLKDRAISACALDDQASVVAIRDPSRSQGWPVRAERRAQGVGPWISRPMREDLSSVERAVGVEDRSRVVLPRVVGAPGEALAQRRGGRLVGEEAPNDGRPVVRFTDAAIGHCVLADLAQHRDVAREHRRSAGEGLDDREPESLRVARDEHRFRPLVKRGQRRPRNSPGEHDAVSDPETIDVRPLRVGERRSPLDEEELGEPGAETGERLEEDIEALARNTAADVKEIGSALQGHEDVVGLRIFLRFGCELLGDAVGGMDEARRSDEAAPLDLGSHGLGAVEDEPRRAQAEEGYPLERAEPGGPGLLGRFEERAERVQVVAINPGALVRQDVNELRVRVIDHVKEVVPPALSRRERGIGEEAPGAAVDLEGARAGEPRDPPREIGQIDAEGGRVDAAREHGLPLVEEHLADEVHRYPVFIG